MTDTAIEAVLRHDRAIVAGALFVLAGLAWAYMLWLAADMDMGGMDMSGFRMIPAGMALMMPTTVPLERDRIRIRLCDVGSNDGRHDDAIGNAHDPHLCARRAPGGATGKAVRREFLVCKRLSSSLGRLCSCCDIRAMGAGTGELAYARDGSCKRDHKRHHSYCSRSLSVDAA